jgi:hypothetical protein
MQMLIPVGRSGLAIVAGYAGFLAIIPVFGGIPSWRSTAQIACGCSLHFARGSDVV